MGKVRVCNKTARLFADRKEAGGLLSKELGRYKDLNSIVLGIPRGGIVIAREAAIALDIELDIMLTRKIRAPGNPELAIGSVSESGKKLLDRFIVDRYRIDGSYIKSEIETQILEIKRRTEIYRHVLPKASLKGRTVIVVDDGIATGSTMQAALSSCSREESGKVICAVPVGPQDTIEKIADYCDEVVCLYTPQDFSAVGQFYGNFKQVSDDEVIGILKEEKIRRDGRAKWRQI